MEPIQKDKKRGSKKSVGIFVLWNQSPIHASMETNQLQILAQVVLSSAILNYFTVTDVEQTPSEIHIHLDERVSPELSNDVHFESKGFMEAVSVTDFPICAHKGYLKSVVASGLTSVRERVSVCR